MYFFKRIKYARRRSTSNRTHFSNRKLFCRFNRPQKKTSFYIWDQDTQPPVGKVASNKYITTVKIK